MGKLKLEILKKLSFWRILVLSFCAIVTACVFCVLLFVYEPGQNSPGALGSAYMDIICMVILLILVLSLLYEREKIGKTTKLFLALMLGTKWAVFFDFLTWSLDGSLKYGDWTYWFTVASLCSGSILACLLVLYLYSYMYDMYKLESLHIRARVCAICNLVAFVVTFILALTHYAFVFVDGHYKLGMFYDVITVIPILTLIYMTVFSIKNVKIIGIHDVVAVVAYILLMVTGALVEASFGIGATYVSITVADVFIFVMLQNRLLEKSKQQRKELEKNVEKWMQRSNTDEVTRFLNRHAYEEEMASLEKRKVKDNFVYVSMDVNGLKLVNDTLGHEAGDELILGASHCMRQCFGPYGKLFRIGGDEFIALIIANEIELDIIMKEFAKVTQNWRGKLIERLTISCGYVTKKEAEGLSLHQIAVLADKRMYKSKKEYYQKKGVDRRGQSDAHVALCALYTKILKINVNEDSFQIVNMDERENSKEIGLADKLSEWFKNFGTMGFVHPDDLEEYLSKTNLEYIRNHFMQNKKSLRIFYRRKYGDEYKKTMMELIPANEYDGDEDMYLFLYVKNIDEQ